MRLISASRRTDIPAFYGEWFMHRLRAGYCHWINPFGGQIYRVSLRPEDCAGIVFWTRYAAALLPHLAEIVDRGYRFYCHFTLNGYDATLEAHTPPLDKAVQSFRVLSGRVSPGRTFWRYDPIVLSDRTPVSDHLERFSQIAQQLRGYTERCYFSFVDSYGKTSRNLTQIERNHGVKFFHPNEEIKRSMVTALKQIAGENGITLYACCEDALLATGVAKARCVDLDAFESVGLNLKRRPTREQCGCSESVDIGAYDTCRFGCVYCYATNSYEAAKRRAASHDPADSALWRPSTLAGQDLAKLESRR